MGISYILLLHDLFNQASTSVSTNILHQLCGSQAFRWISVMCSKNFVLCHSPFLTLSCFFFSSVPDDQSLRMYRAEANWGLMRFSDALMDLDYLCCLRPSWAEVRERAALDKHITFCFYNVFFWHSTKKSVVLPQVIPNLKLSFHFSSPLCKL